MNEKKKDLNDYNHYPFRNEEQREFTYFMKLLIRVLLLATRI